MKSTNNLWEQETLYLKLIPLTFNFNIFKITNYVVQKTPLSDATLSCDKGETYTIHEKSEPFLLTSSIYII